MYIQRSLESVIRKYLAGPEYLAVTGARQAGKTTLLRHIQETVKNSVFLTFEDIEIRALFDKDVKSFIKLYVEPHRFLFIDEFQYAKKGGQSLKFIFDTVPGKKIIVSGSSALDLTIAAVKHLAGRILSFTLYPLSFQEFLSFKDPALFQIRAESKGRLEKPVIDRIRKILDEFVVFGGYQPWRSRSGTSFLIKNSGCLSSNNILFSKSISVFWRKHSSFNSSNRSFPIKERSWSRTPKFIS
jgi:predicted AAA+ superfamily ATPase